MNMKTIAVLTDFSERSVHAAKYALHLAQEIEAYVLLFNAFLVLELSSKAGQYSGPVEDYEHVRANRVMKLKGFANKLREELKEKRKQGAFIPEINYQCEEGMLANSIAELEENKKIVLLVIGTHGVDDKSAFMMGNNCRQVIDAATLPLLIIPENASIKTIEKFAFATDNSISDLDYINSLTELARHTSAEITVLNVNEASPANSEGDPEVNLFKQQMAEKLYYSQVYYRSIPNQNVKNGLEWFVENVGFDMMVMVHRKSSLYDYFFKPSITKKIADQVYVPLLVYPYPVDSLPNF